MTNSGDFTSRLHACPNCVFKTKTCGPSGPIDSPFVIVGESPGLNEVKSGQPFIGESGQLLRKHLALAGLSGVQPYITNAIKCIPGLKKDQRTLAAACQSCSDALYREISAHPRKVILALGAGALWSLTGNYKLKITQVRGNIYKSPFATEGIVASVHPAFLLRGGGSLPKFKQDLQLAVDLLTGKTNLRQSYTNSDYYVLETHDQVLQLYNTIREELSERAPHLRILACDTEASGLWPLHHKMLCLGVAWKPEHTYIIPDTLLYDREGGTAAVRTLMTVPSDQIRYLWHNGKCDVQFYWRIGIRARVDEDTMLQSYTLDEVKGQHSLEQVAADAVGAPNWKAMLDGYIPKGGSYADIPRPVLYKYLGRDVSATLQSHFVLRERIRSDTELNKAYTKVLIPASDTLAHAEYNGFAVDPEQNKKNAERLSNDLASIQTQMDAITSKLFGKTINIQSPLQLAALIYDDLRLPKIKGSRSTDKDHMESLPPHPVVKLVLEYRKAAKALGTYVLNLPGKIDPKTRKRKQGKIQRDGRVRSTYLLHGATTGRLASRDPNMQNIPRDPELRAQFIAFKRRLIAHLLGKPEIVDTVIIEVDLNQAELRVLAELSGDPGLMSIYLDPEHPGLHHELSVTLFGPDYTGEHKMRAKAVNFGIVYGRTGASLAEEFELPREEGDRWVAGWFRRFPVAGEFIEHCRNAPLEGKRLITPFGRKRRFGVVNRENLRDIQNQAANYLPQSIASDITLIANGKVIKDPRYRGYLINLVHDSGMHEVEDNIHVIREQSKLVIDYMEQEPKLWGLTKVPFKAEAKYGKAWGRLKPVPFSDN